MEYAGYLASLLIGIALGLIGGGGSILTIPILVYLFGISPKSATSYSLFIVGFTAAIGAVRHYLLGNIRIRSAMVFALPSLATLLLVRKMVLPALPDMLFDSPGFVLSKDTFIMALFALLMVAASYSMIRTKSPAQPGTLQPVRIAIIGAIVGVITGFLGAGGGFLIIPALIFFTGIDMKQAVGTSLLIIAFNSLLGFAGDVIGGAEVNYRLLFSVSAFATVGIFIGTQLSRKIDGNRLKPAFGWFVLVMGLYIIGRELLAR